MKTETAQALLRACALLGLLIAFSPSTRAATFSFTGLSSDGHPVSGTADFTLNASADTVLVKLTNTTVTTLDAGELFTGLDFGFGGLTPSLATDTGIQRTVDAGGAFSDTGSAQDLS